MRTEPTFTATACGSAAWGASALGAVALGAIMMLIPAWSPASAQESPPIGPTRSPIISPAGPVSFTLTRKPVPARPHDRPTWVVDGVPDSVWMLVEDTWTTEDKDRKKELLERAEVHARAAYEEDLGPRFALAVVLASRADVEGGRTQVRLASDFHREVEAILELDPEHARSHHLLGRLYAGVRRTNPITRWVATNLLGGGALKKATWQGAEEHLAFAEQWAPEVSGHHLQLAALYADTDREELALQELEHVFEWPVVFPLEQHVWDRSLEMREEWQRQLVRKAERAAGCRKARSRRAVPRRSACR